MVPTNPFQQQQFQGRISAYGHPHQQYTQTQAYDYDQQQYYGQVQQTFDLEMPVRLVVRVQQHGLDTLPPVSGSLIIPSVSVSKQYGGSVNYVVTHQGEGSWMVTVTPLHGGQYYVTASLQQQLTAASTYEDEYKSTAAYKPKNSQYRFIVSGRPAIGARVRRGPNWPQGNNEDGGIGNGGTVISPSTKKLTTVRQTQLRVADDSFVYVEWDNGNREQYEWGRIFPIELVPY